MKNFDIEQLERKNIYKTPENFFSGMQENVLKQTVHTSIKKETEKPAAKILPMKTNWMYAAAAALAMILGLGYVFTNMNSTEQTPVEIADAQTKTEIQKVAAQNNINEQNNALVIENQLPQENISQDLTFEKSSNPTTEQVRTAPREQRMAVKSFANPAAAKNVKTVSMNKKEMMEQMVTTFTSAELAEASKDAEQDIYLDLYN